MSKLKFEVSHDEKRVKPLFNQFSKKEWPYDEWEFRSVFHRPTKFPLHFYLGYLENEIIGVLPLQFNQEKNFLEFFGGDFIEYNHVYLKEGHESFSKEFYLHLLKNSKENLNLRDFTDGDSTLPGFAEYDQTYTLNLKEFSSVDDFLEKRFSSKSRNKLRKKIKEVKEHQIEIVENNFDDIDLLIDFNKKRFKEESSFANPNRVESFCDLLNLDWNFIIQTFIVDGKKEAVSLSLIYKDIFMYLMAGSNIEKIPNLGSYVVLNILEKAFSKESRLFDAARNPSGWKDRWHLDPHPCFKLVLER